MSLKAFSIQGANLKFISTYEICPLQLDLRNVISQVEECKSDCDQKTLLDRIILRYRDEQKTPVGIETRKVLMELFIRLGAKKSLRKHVYEKLDKEYLDNVTLFDHIISAISSEIFTKINEEHIFNTSQCLHLLNFLFTFTQNFQSDLAQYENFMEKTKMFYLCTMEVLTSQLHNQDVFEDRIESILKNDDVYTILDYTLKHLLTVLAKVNRPDVITYNVEFAGFCHEILKINEQLKYETCAKCALLMTYFLNSLDDADKEFIKYKDIPILDYVEHPSDANFSLKFKDKLLDNIFLTDKMKLVLYAAIVNSIDKDKLVSITLESHKTLLEFLYTNFIDFARKMTGYPDQIVLIARTLSEMCEHLDKIPMSTAYDEGIHYSWAHLDHFIETVVHSTKLFFKKLVHLSADFYFTGTETRYLDNLFQTLNSMSRFSKVRLSALEIVCAKVEPQFILNTFHDLQQYLISVIPDTDMGQLAGNTYIQIMLRHANDLSSEEFTSIWVRPVMDILRQRSTENTAVFQRIVTCGIQKKPLIFRQLFPAKYVGNSAESIIILRCVNVARTKGMVFPMEPDRNRNEYWRDLILKKMLELFMIHQDEEVRLWALQVVVECQKSTEEFFEWEVLYLLSYFSYNVSTQLSSVRKKIASFYKKIFQRYQASYNVIVKKITIEQSKKNVELVAHYERVKKFYRGFLTQFINLLSSNLAPDSNYSRRALSLELLLVIREYSGSIEWKRCLGQDDVVNLLNVLNDTYESNKAMAVSVIKCLPSSFIGFENEEQTRAYFDRSLDLACDMKPNTTITASYMLQVVLHSQFPFKLEQADKPPIYVHDFRYFVIVLLIDRLDCVYSATKSDIVKGIATTPFHGLLLSIRTLLSSRSLKEYNNLYVCVFSKLMEMLEDIKDAMMPIVCNAAPEGYLPETAAEETLNLDVLEDQSSISQMNLVAAWKTMKEMMLLLAEIVKQTVFLETDLDMMRMGQLEHIGNMFLDIFITTKHRGVFEQAGAAFAIICQEFVKSKYEHTSVLPMKWLDDAISLCTGKRTDDRLCATRRSAGLPFLILSIVSTQAENNIVYFQKTMEQLLLVANNTNENNDELRTHCLNILRFLFLNSKLGDLVPSYIGSAAIAALVGFESRTWGVRNSATLLYSALITRIFGVQRTSDSEHLSSKNRLTLAVFYMRYPKLFDFLLETLAKECEKTSSLILHPVLLILARLYPSHNDKVNEKVDKHIGFIATCIGNTSYRTRDLAARASVSLIPAKFVTKHLADGFRKISDRKIRNLECHGVLLQMWHLLKMNKIHDTFDIEDCLQMSFHILRQDEREFSHATVSLYMEVISQLFIKFRDFENFETFKEILRLISNYRIGGISTARNSLVWNRFELTLCILINKFPYIRTTFNIITKEIITFLYGQDLRLKRNCLYFLIYLNQLCSHQEFKEHPLIESSEVEIPDSICELVDSFDDDSRKQLLTSTHKILVYFFYGQLKNQTIHNQDCLVLVFLLLNYYPCVYCQIHLDSKQDILDLLLNVANHCDSSEELVSSVISCLSRFILTLDFDDLKTLEYSGLIRVLMRSASPAAAYFRRLSVAQFLVICQEACRDSIFQDLERYNMLNIIMVLLEDEERYIRNTMSTYPAKEKRVAGNTVLEVIPDKARADLMVSSVSMLRHQIAVCFLTSWSLRYLPEVTTCPTVKKVYDRTDLNLFAENIPVTYSACKVLNSLLWPLENSLNYEDKSIFLEEQTLVVTTIILNALIKLPSPMMDKYTKTVVICALKCVAKYLEEYSIGNEFHKNFKTFFSNKVLKYLRTSLKQDYSSVKFFFTYIYNPILKTNMKLLLK